MVVDGITTTRLLTYLSFIYALYWGEKVLEAERVDFPRNISSSLIKRERRGGRNMMTHSLYSMVFFAKSRLF